MLLRLGCLAVSDVFAVLRLLPWGTGIKTWRSSLSGIRSRSWNVSPASSECASLRQGRALPATLPHRLPRQALRRLRLLVRPDTVPRWHRGLIAGRHTVRPRPERPGRPRTVRSVRLLVLRLAGEDPGWGYRRLYGGLLMPG